MAAQAFAHSHHLPFNNIYCCKYQQETLSGSYLLLVREVIPHAGQKSGKFTIRQVRPVLLKLLPLFLSKNEHGRDRSLWLNRTTLYAKGEKARRVRQKDFKKKDGTG